MWSWYFFWKPITYPVSGHSCNQLGLRFKQFLQTLSVFPNKIGSRNESLLKTPSAGKNPPEFMIHFTTIITLINIVNLQLSVHSQTRSPRGTVERSADTGTAQRCARTDWNTHSCNAWQPGWARTGAPYKPVRNTTGTQKPGRSGHIPMLSHIQTNSTFGFCDWSRSSERSRRMILMTSAPGWHPRWCGRVGRSDRRWCWGSLWSSDTTGSPRSHSIPAPPVSPDPSPDSSTQDGPQTQRPIETVTNLNGTCLN